MHALNLLYILSMEIRTNNLYVHSLLLVNHHAKDAYQSDIYHRHAVFGEEDTRSQQNDRCDVYLKLIATQISY